MTLFSRDRSMTIVRTLGLAALALALALASAGLDRSAHGLSLVGPEQSMRWVLPVAQAAVLIPVLHAQGVWRRRFTFSLPA